MAIRLLIADDHQVVRSGLESLLSGTEFELVGQARDGVELLRMAEELQPDVILLDIRMPEKDGLEALEQLREKFPDIKVLILSNYDNPTYIARAITMGAADYLLKG